VENFVLAEKRLFLLFDHLGQIAPVAVPGSKEGRKEGEKTMFQGRKEGMKEGRKEWTIGRKWKERKEGRK
jgi:hypothetical protein